MEPARPAHRRPLMLDSGDPAQQTVAAEWRIVPERGIAPSDDEFLTHRDETVGDEEIPAAKHDDLARLRRRRSEEGLDA